jgi:hypothetical protein
MTLFGPYLVILAVVALVGTFLSIVHHFLSQAETPAAPLRNSQPEVNHVGFWYKIGQHSSY